MGSTISEEEWKHIIYYIYDKEDATLIETQIIDHIRTNNEVYLVNQSNNSNSNW